MIRSQAALDRSSTSKRTTRRFIFWKLSNTKKVILFPPTSADDIIWDLLINARFAENEQHHSADSFSLLPGAAGRITYF
jgi:hypothetical protein